MRIALDQTGGHGIPPCILKYRVHRADHENTGQQRSQRSSRPMYAEGVEQIVVAKLRLDLGYHRIAEHARDQSDDQRRHRLHETRCWSDRQQARNRSRDSSQHARLSVADPLGPGPSHRGGSRRKVRRDKCAGRQTTRCQRAPRIESKPSHPQQACANEAQHHTMRRHCLLRIPHPLA